MSKYLSDYLDEACTQMYGHTNWEYDDRYVSHTNKIVVIFHKESLDEEPMCKDCNEEATEFLKKHPSGEYICEECWEVNYG